MFVTNGQLAYDRVTCRLCGSSNLWTAIPLHPLPVASPNVGRSALVTETASADVRQCIDCGHLQLATIVNPEFQYRNFKYLTGISLGLREHFERLVATVSATGDVAPGKFVIDIGSNDGSLLRFVKAHGARILGIDPAEQIAKAATEAGIPTLANFFTTALAGDIVRQHGQADVVISNNTIANIDELGAFFAGIDALLAKDGILVIETQYALDMLTKTLLDVVYHEHISYFAVRPMQRFLQAHGFELINAERIAPKGGSIRFVVQRQGGPRASAANVSALIEEEDRSGFYDKRIFEAFNSRIRELGQRLREHLAESRQKTGRGLAYGASVGCAALIHYFELGELIDAVFDDTPLTNVLRTSQGDIPVLTGRQLANEPPTDVIVLAWRYASVVAKGQEVFRASGGRFFRALPDVALVDGSDNALPLA
jgi:2-polyprenyl-3-methyl-5-hydroxy-6-metoxy-1,4-benzoquinol methylase